MLNIKEINPAKIIDINDKDKEVKNLILPLLLYFCETTSSVYKMQLSVKSNNSSNKYIDKSKEKREYCCLK